MEGAQAAVDALGEPPARVVVTDVIGCCRRPIGEFPARVDVDVRGCCRCPVSFLPSLSPHASIKSTACGPAHWATAAHLVVYLPYIVQHLIGTPYGLTAY
eukprot:scaffold44784_cov21-Tisochrysis_lutea.AAC.1